jgi:hypothetical protein
MTGPEHYKAAEELIEAARGLGANAAEVARGYMEKGIVFDPVKAMQGALSEAQVHATLALAAATAQNIRQRNAMDAGLADDWVQVSQ